MKGDLISRSALVQSLRNNVLVDVTASLEQAIAEQPAAYDADKVIRKIVAATNIDGLVFYVDGRPVIYKDQAIEIIRSGGR